MIDYRKKQENSLNNPVAVVLGGTVPHGELIRALKERNFYTIVIDYFENPPAAKYADVHCHESAMDYDVVLTVAKENNASLVLSSCLDQQINIAMKVAEELGISHPFSSETALRVTNKQIMKQIMMDEGIPTSKYYVVDENTDVESLKLTYPIIVKPEDSCGSAGIIKLDSPEGMKEAINMSLVYSNSGKVIVEEFVDGTEMGVHGYVEDGQAHILFGTCKITVINQDKYQQLCTVYVPNLKPALMKELKRIAELIVKGFELPSYTPMFMQVIVRGDSVSVIEFSPRVAGGTTSYVAKECAGFDLLNYSIDSYLGEETHYECGELGKFACCFPLYCKEGVLGEIVGVEQILEEDIAMKAFILKEIGDHIDTKKPSSSNVLKYVIEGNTSQECFDKIQMASKITDIVDVNGQSMREQRFVLTQELFDEKLAEIM